MNELINLIGVACFGVLCVVAEPIVKLKAFFGFSDLRYGEMTTVKAFIHRLLGCPMCITFWIALFWFWSIPLAAFASILAAMIYKTI